MFNRYISAQDMHAFTDKVTQLNCVTLSVNACISNI